MRDGTLDILWQFCRVDQVPRTLPVSNTQNQGRTRGEKRIDDFVPQPILAVLVSERSRVLYPISDPAKPGGFAYVSG